MYICPECGEGYPTPGTCKRDGAQLFAAGQDDLLGKTIGSWRVARLLGEGGMGRVYKAVQPSIGSRVAIKVITGQATPDLVDRFFAEARAVNLIRHEGIVNVLALDRLADGRPYIVMEYLDGAALSAVLEKRGPLPLGSLVQLATEVLDALAAAHGRGIIHRDLKPDNVWVTTAGRAKVLDFGIAKLDPGVGGHQATRAGSILGTPAYMSPEQAQAKAIDARSDLYAMGVILYAAATGKAPFNHESLFELLRMHIQDPPPPPRAARPDLPPQLEAAILKALEKDPARRYASAVEMSAALNAASAALPPDAWVTLRGESGAVPFRPRTTTARAGRRWPIVAAAGAVVVVAAGVVVAATRGGSPAPVAAAAPPVTKAVPTPVSAPAPPPAPAAPVPAAILDPTRFDAIAYLREAQRLARAAFPDADLVGMTVPQVQFDGMSNLTLEGAPVARYLFRSAAASKPGAACLFEVAAAAAGVKAERKTDAECAQPILGLPTCTLADLWNDALNAKVPGDLRATLEWTQDDQGNARWKFQPGEKKIRWFDDGCAHE